MGCGASSEVSKMARAEQEHQFGCRYEAQEGDAERPVVGRRKSALPDGVEGAVMWDPDACIAGEAMQTGVINPARRQLMHHVAEPGEQREREQQERGESEIEAPQGPHEPSHTSSLRLSRRIASVQSIGRAPARLTGESGAA